MDSLTFTIDLKNINDPDEPQQVVEDLKLLFRFLMNANPNYYLVGNMLYEQLDEQIKEDKPVDPRERMQKCLDGIAPDVVDGRIPDINAAYCDFRSTIGEAMGPVSYAAYTLATRLKDHDQSTDWVWNFVKYYEEHWEF